MVECAALGQLAGVMRNEHEIYSALIDWAFASENIRAIVVNGSRSDPSRTPDALSDYDAAVIVRDLDPILNDFWIHRFGKIMVRWPLQPQPTSSPDWVTQLVLFEDGVRIDFQFTTPDVQELERAGPFHCVLLDRERLTESIQGRAIPGTPIRPPTEHEFADRINAFWWDIPYVAKALTRGEVDYARYVMEGDLRFNKLHPLLRWHVGVSRGWDTDIGIFGRWLPHHLEPGLWRVYLTTFSGADVEDQWRAMFAMMEFVDLIGNRIARNLRLSYPDSVATNVTSYLRSIEQTRFRQGE